MVKLGFLVLDKWAEENLTNIDICHKLFNLGAKMVEILFFQHKHQ